MNMACANRECNAELKYLRGGRLFLLEREPSLNRLVVSDPCQTKRPVTMRRYFWLCESCAQTYVLRRWTESGIELAFRHPAKPAVKAPMPAYDWPLPGLVG
jgi:hypothetical protein